MRIVWFSWKDIKNPLSGGAEVVAHALAQRLVRDGHAVTIICGGFKDAQGKPAPSYEDISGYSVVRVGGRYSVYIWAWRYFAKKYMRSIWNLWQKPRSVAPDIVVEEINAVPFMTRFYVDQTQAKRYLFVHQLAREIWFHEMFAPLSWIGYQLEPFYLKLLHKEKVITVSQSTKHDLQQYGFLPGNISIITEGTTIAPLHDLAAVEKYENPTILSLGSVRSMKRTDQIVRAFEIFKNDHPQAKLVIAGNMDGPYAKKVLQVIERSAYVNDIKVCGRVDQETKISLMQRAHLIAVTSVKEGWGLIVTEAGSQGTPAVVYDVDGLRDSVRNGSTGLIARENTPEGLAEVMREAFLIRDHQDTLPLYYSLGKNAWRWSRQLTFDQSYADFTEALRINQ